MKIRPIEMSSNRDCGDPAKSAKNVITTALGLMFSLGLVIAKVQAQEVGNDVQGVQVLTRGPVHEAFAGIVSFNPEPGVIVAKKPPGLIEELPPDERPVGENITWIPGYWAWDDERGDFLWISGTWRALPPGRGWIAGYWTETAQGNQWISGYWSDATIRETTYLPKPPATVEEGPNLAAPSPDHGWMPGSWIWHEERYAWSPGYWAQGRTNWEWIPAHYVWTPRGYVFVDGYWDYAVSRRGVLFAPVYLNSNVYSQRGYRYSPAIVIDLASLIEHWFLRPRYHHYYFGDYYAPEYHERGFYSSFAFQSNRYGYDPIYSHRRWEHRQERDWERRVEESYQYRRDHVAARPPRTWAAQTVLQPDGAELQSHRLMMGAPLDQLAKRKDGAVRFQKVPDQERRNLEQRGQDVRKSRDQRRALEVMDPANAESQQEIRPARIKLPKSPIMGRPPGELAKTQAPPRPQRTHTPISKEPQRKQTPDRQQESDTRQQQPEKPGPAKEQSKPGVPREPPGRDVEQPESKRQTVEPKEQPKRQSPPRKPDASSEQRKPGRNDANPRGKTGRPQTEDHAVEPQGKTTRREPQRESKEPARKARQDAQGHAGKETSRPAGQPKPNASETGDRAGASSRPPVRNKPTQGEDPEESTGSNHKKAPK